jgi:hypothetical protein
MATLQRPLTPLKRSSARSGSDSMLGSSNIIEKEKYEGVANVNSEEVDLRVSQCLVYGPLSHVFLDFLF